MNVSGVKFAVLGWRDILTAFMIARTAGIGHLSTGFLLYKGGIDSEYTRKRVSKLHPRNNIDGKLPTKAQ